MLLRFRVANVRSLRDEQELSFVAHLVHAGTTNSERTTLASTWFHHTALRLASTTTNGVDTGFIREPAATLNSMTTGGSPPTT
ncbi:hypothetical protein ACFVOK_07645 [Streptomyces sp. NPDC057798]|uniref:hypothetical protein n=1 Tax=Streptomyces sp. NPDC057798 TaxID=3346252 RepID=UPI0036CA16BE